MHSHHKFRIETVPVCDLVDLAKRVASDPRYSRVAPITRIRSESQVRNPHARPGDVALLVAFDGDRCIGYHGLIPLPLRVNGEQSVVHWATAFFVSAEYRGQGVGRRLLNWIKSAGIDFVTPQMTPSAERAYRGAGYRELGRLTYYQLRVDRLGSTTFDRRRLKTPTGSSSPAAATIGRLVVRLHAGLYRLLKRRFYRGVVGRLPVTSAAVRIRAVEQIDLSHQPFLESGIERPRFFRGVDTINWMMAHPWLVSRQDACADVRNYYFSHVRDRFGYAAYEIDAAEAGHPVGFFVLSISSKRGRTRLKILDYDLRTAQAFQETVVRVLQTAASLFVDRIEYPAAFHAFFKALPRFKKLIKTQRRLYLHLPAGDDSPLARAAGDIELGYCDGDTAFT